MAAVIHVWCDGSFWEGIGGWAAVLTADSVYKEITGSETGTTSQRMEMTAGLEGLRAVRVRGAAVTVHSDSAYLVNCWNEDWFRRWRENGWITSAKKPVSNRDLWSALAAEVTRLDVTWEKVRGHTGVALNERADALASRARFERAGLASPPRRRVGRGRRPVGEPG